MITTVALLLTQSLTFFLGGHSRVEGWRGIVPLHSTRADVERLLGAGANECKCAYYLEDVNVFFDYSSGDCKSGGVWDVPSGTVMRITVYTKPTLRWSTLNVDKSKFIKKQDGHIKANVSYTNDDEGLTLQVNEETDIVMGFYYIPSAKDQHLRCR